MTAARTPARPVLFGFLVLATVVVLSGASFACTVFKGTMTLTPGAGAADTAVGSGIGMSYCPGKAAGNTAAVGNGQTFTVAVGPSTDCADQLDDTTATRRYSVNWIRIVRSPTTGSQLVWDCMNAAGAGGGGTGTGFKLGDITVSGGSGSGTYSIGTTNGFLIGEANVCVSDLTGAQGMMLPVRLVAI